MADTKGSQLTNLAAMSNDDVFIVVNDPEGTPVTSRLAKTGLVLETGNLSDDAVTYAKLQNVSATDKILGRSTAGSGNVEEIACTPAGRALLDDASAAAQRNTLQLGAVSTLNTVPVVNGGSAATSPVEAQVNLVPMFGEPGNFPAVGFPYFQLATSVVVMGDGAVFIGRNQMTRSQSFVFGNSFASGDNCIAMCNMDNFGGKGARVDNSIAIGRQASVGSVNNAGIGGIALGYLNTITNSFLFSSGNHGTAIGNGNTVNAPTTGSGNLGTAIGDTNTVNALQGTAIGKQACSQNYGSYNYGSGQFAVVGDAQHGRYILRNKTTNATVTSLFLNGSSERLKLQDNQSMKIRGQVVAHDLTRTKYAAWSFEALVTRGTGVASVLAYTATGPNPTTLSAGANNVAAQVTVGSASAWVLNVGADTTNGAIDLKVTGEAGVTIAWVANLESVEVIH